MNGLYQNRFQRSLNDKETGSKENGKSNKGQRKCVGVHSKFNINNNPEFMSLEVNCEHSILYPIEYKPLYKPCYIEIKDHIAFR